MRYLPAVVLAFFLTGGAPAGVLPIAQPNDNRTPAGTVGDSGVTLSLEAKRVMWHPNGDSLRGRFTEAFGEAGKEPTVPGPLVRVRAGTVVRIRVTNTDISDTLRFVLAPLLMRGIDTLKVPPGQAGEIRFTPSQPGNFYYRALTSEVLSRLPFAMKGLLAGAIVVDSASGTPRPDRVFVVNRRRPARVPARPPAGATDRWHGRDLRLHVHANHDWRSAHRVPPGRDPAGESPGSRAVARLPTLSAVPGQRRLP